MPSATLRRAAQPRGPRGFDPLRIIDLETGFREEVPSVIEFCLSDKFLNRPNLYPRQATLLKIMFLQKDLLTQYDYDVIGEWSETYRHTEDERGEGNNGIVPDVLERMDLLIAQGRPWFRQTSNISGRRGSKGHIGGQAGAYVLWNYMSLGDPQGHFGVDRDKPLTGIVFAGKKDQALKNQWGDLNSVILGGPCFSQYISKPMGESLSVYSPYDWIRMDERQRRGIKAAGDMATFQIVPKESTLMAGRGPASFMQCLDPATPVLTADLCWVPIGELVPGDRVVGVDESPAQGQRKMRDAEVQAVWRTRKAALRLTFADGSSVVCSPDHRWLTKDMGSGGSSKWRTAETLTVGNRIKHLVDPWVEDDTRDGGYLAGLYDGEGCISGWSGRAGKSVFFSQLPGPVLDSTLSLLKDRGFTPVRTNTGQVEQWALNGTEAMAFLGSIRPQRLLTKAKSVWDGVAPRGGATSSGRVKPDSHKTITSIEHLPEQELVDITTSTRTFIANGLISHNCYDEMAHVVATGANRSAEEVFQAATPSLDQFGNWGWIYIPTSPWQKIGQAYVEYQQSIEMVDGPDGTKVAAYPEKLMIQLTSWDIYKDWEIAHTLPREPGELPFHRLRNAIQTYDDNMKQLERANPETFRVERRSQWASAMNAYLNPDRVADFFKGYPNPEIPLQQRGRGILSEDYRAHGDPSKSGAGFGFAMAHIAGYDEQGLPHVVFDQIRSWNPADFPNHEIDYNVVETDLEDVIDTFMPTELTFDQFNSVGTIQRLQKYALKRHLPKRVTVYERTATGPLNWKTYETFKTALNMGLLHGPYFELADLELTFLQDLGGKVEHPTSGPVQTKDVADCIAIVTYELIGNQMSAFIGKSLGEVHLQGVAQGGFNPYGEHEQAHEALSGFGRRSGMPGGGSFSPARGGVPRGMRRGRS